MTVMLRLVGTFSMFVGFLTLAAGWTLFRLKQEKMAKLFLANIFLGGGGNT